MKKILRSTFGRLPCKNWVMAATLICGAMVFTACTSNEDNSGTKDDGHAKKALLIVLDGWGIGDKGQGDAIARTATPYIDYLKANYPHTELQASGEYVGLPDGQMGNSETGHLNIGAGRIVYQDLVKINRACADNSILENPEIKAAYSYAKANGKNLHLMGLTSTGGVHASLDHLLKLIDIAKMYDIQNCYVHCFMDGRDTDPRAGKGFIADVQQHIAETEKYAHVTSFINGGREEPFAGEDRILVASPKVATYDLKPEMSAFEVKDKLVEAIKTDKYDWIVVNFANADMVGHTGVYTAIEQAVKVIDQCLNEVVETAKVMGYETIITADHGNADHAINADGTPNTAHSTNPVPFIYVTANKNAKVRSGILADVAPSVLHIMGLQQPKEMTGQCLISE